MPDSMEDYWEELEGDYERREKAIEWMKNLPAGRDGTVAFLNEVTEEHCKAFLLSITIHHRPCDLGQSADHAVREAEGRHDERPRQEKGKEH